MKLFIKQILISYGLKYTEFNEEMIADENDINDEEEYLNEDYDGQDD